VVGIETSVSLPFPYRAILSELSPGSCGGEREEERSLAPSAALHVLERRTEKKRTREREREREREEGRRI